MIQHDCYMYATGSMRKRLARFSYIVPWLSTSEHMHNTEQCVYVYMYMVNALGQAWRPVVLECRSRSTTVKEYGLDQHQSYACSK